MNASSKLCTTMITPYNLLRHELVGLPVKARVQGVVFEGTVEQESAKTFTITTPKGSKKVIKGSSTLEFTLPHGAVVSVAGHLLAQRPEDRIKKRHRIRY